VNTPSPLKHPHPYLFLIPSQTRQNPNFSPSASKFYQLPGFFKNPLLNPPNP
jgi:hypothetical protein